MYLKSISFDRPKDLSSPAQKSSENPASVRESFLVYGEREGTDFQFFDLRVPFLMGYESVDVDTDQSVYMEFSEQGNFSARSPYSEYLKIPRMSHSHDFYEITYVLSGRLSMHIEDEVVSYEAGECCICNKNIHHLEVMDESTEFVLLMFKDSFVKALLQADTPEGKPTANPVFGLFFAENRHNPLYDAKVYTDYRSPDSELRDSGLVIINQLTAELMSDHLGKGHMIRALLCRFLEHLERSPGYHTQVHSAKLSREEPLVYTIAHAYRRHTDILTRREIERLTGYSSDHVERIIKRQTGMTLSEYGRQFLLQRAAAMLRGTNKSVSDICETLGYSNRTYFNQIFKNRFGMTPAQYRKQYRGQI